MKKNLISSYLRSGNYLVLFLLVSIVFAMVALNNPSEVFAAQEKWYVSTDGSDGFGDGSFDYPFLTIQHGIDRAQTGDVVIVLEGSYSGPGNVDLDFKGKAITVQSRDPEDNECLRATIIDAQGTGIIVQFIQDEGPESAFIGFTLNPGDTSRLARGLPGYFEFSDKARPTTRKLRLMIPEAIPNAAQVYQIEGNSTNSEFVWQGFDPFHQPVDTTDYYGSGDVNLDGSLTSQDAVMAQEMMNGQRVSSYRADVDGDQSVNSSDIALINGALSGGTLPAWWNNLTSEAQRNAWFDTIVDIDPTDMHPYTYWWVCGNFANQFFLHATYQRNDLFFSQYDGGPTWFNLPVYTVSPGIGHVINAILTGDDPLNFDDWRFIEPQDDSTVEPGMWNMPYGGVVSIRAPTIYNSTNVTIVRFYVDETGWSLVDYHPNLILVRTPPSGVTTPRNQPDIWSPRIVSATNNFALFDRTRDDMSHMTDIHIQNLPDLNPTSGLPLTLSTQYSRLLDVYRAPDGSVGLLWKGKDGYLPGIYYGVLDPATQSLGNISRVTTDERIAHEGRLVVTPSGDIHLFWLDQGGYGGYPHAKGIYWTYWNGSGWQMPQNLTPGAGAILSTGAGWNIPDNLYYIFDVAVGPSGVIDLIWAEPREWNADINAFVRHLRYTDHWTTPTTIASTASYTLYPLGVEIAYDTHGLLHLVYWQGNINDPWDQLIHQTFDGTSWSASQLLTAYGKSGFPRLTTGWDGRVYLVWEESYFSRIIPYWKTYQNGSWGPAWHLAVEQGASGWYPSGELLADGNLIFVWVSNSSGSLTIGSQLWGQTPPSHLTVTSNADSGPGTLRWAIAAIAPGGTIDFDLPDPSTIHITSGELVVDKPITILGPGAQKLTLSGDHVTRVLNVKAGGDLEMQELTISNGRVHRTTMSQPEEVGGAIRNQGTLTVSYSVISHSEADYGGGIHNSGVLTITASEITYNTATDLTGSGDGGGIYNDGTLNLSRTIVKGNHAVGGGGVLNWGAGTVEMNASEISENTAGNGGGIENGDHGTVWINNQSKIEFNIATVIGGGIVNYNAGTLAIQNTLIANNHAQQDGGGILVGGGGIYNFGNGEITLLDSQIRDNKAIYGGGIRNQGLMTITRTKLLENTAGIGKPGDGGGIYNEGRLEIDDSELLDNAATGGGGLLNWSYGNVTVNRSTFAGNTVLHNGGGIGNGDFAIIRIFNSTLSNNAAIGDGGGIVNFDNGFVEIVSSTLSYNAAEHGGNVNNLEIGLMRIGQSIIAHSLGGGNCYTAITSDGYNLADDPANTCHFKIVLHDLLATDPVIGPLQYNSDWTQTHALLPTSPAIDTIPAINCNVTIDQCSKSRPIDGDIDGVARCDIGSFEYQPPTLYMPLMMKN